MAGKRFTHIAKPPLDLHRSYDWPDNIRELQNVIERVVVLSDGGTLLAEESWLPREPQRPRTTGAPLASTIADRERELIEAALADSGGRIAGPFGAAAKLGVPRQTLDSKIRAFGIDKQPFKRR
jgi:DNA-binding NtrC family response regulator